MLNDYVEDIYNNQSDILHEEPVTIFDQIGSGISMEDAFKGVKNDTNYNMLSETVYIICEKKSFRADALYNMFSGEYNTKIIYTSTDGIPEMTRPLCFVIDITSTDNRAAQKMIYYIQDIAYENNRHIFLIGEPEDIESAKAFFNRRDISVTDFPRPIDVKECIEEIKAIVENPPRIKRTKHVLVVDDSTIFLKLLKNTLGKHYKVTTAQSAFECIKILSGLSEPPDMVIIDYMMPVCDGLTLCGMLKEQPEYKNLAIVFYSGMSDVDNIIQVMPMIDGYILKDKPVTRLDGYLEDIFKKKKKERKSKEEKKEKKKKRK